jgi:hypothetical protein
MTTYFHSQRKHASQAAYLFTFEERHVLVEKYRNAIVTVSLTFEESFSAGTARRNFCSWELGF